jgi:dihydrofolate reductase
MGKRMFNNGEAPWGESPPFHAPVFVITHQVREKVIREGGTTFTFITDGLISALEQARAAAGDKDVKISGSASVMQQYLNAGLLDELQIHLAPVFLGRGVRLFEQMAPHLKLESMRVITSPEVTHLKFRVVK